MERIRTLLSRVMDSQANRLAPSYAEPAFDAPLVGASRADDPMWNTIVGHIGPIHWRPERAYALAFPDEEVSPGELAVIAWVLPQTKATKDDHRKAKNLPSLRWTFARHYGEMINELLRCRLVQGLAVLGVKAVAPVLLPQWDYRESANYGPASNWSERHAAFAAGLGTFGLSDGLITPLGKAVRVGSVVARMDLAPTPRPYGDNHRAYCLHFRKGVCRACAKRCPADAISPDGHDKLACRAYIRTVTAPWVAREQMGVAVNSCGLCQVGVPCQSGIPRVKEERQEQDEP